MAYVYISESMDESMSLYDIDISLHMTGISSLFDATFEISARQGKHFILVSSSFSSHRYILCSLIFNVHAL